MRIVCIRGGPAGLHFALLMKQLDPAHRITVIERNRPYDTFGWGVVFSDATMETMRARDAETADAIEVAFNHWDDIELHFKAAASAAAATGSSASGASSCSTSCSGAASRWTSSSSSRPRSRATRTIPTPT